MRKCASSDPGLGAVPYFGVTLRTKRVKLGPAFGGEFGHLRNDGLAGVAYDLSVFDHGVSTIATLRVLGLCSLPDAHRLDKSRFATT
jgi:hypothetical protein